MGVNHRQISHWERGEKAPTLYNAVGLAVVTQKMVEDVFFDYRQEWKEKILERKKLLDSPGDEKNHPESMAVNVTNQK